MRQKFCTACGATLSEGIKFCESCGTPVDPEIPAPSLQPSESVGQEPVITPIVPSPPPSSGAGKVPVKIIAGIFIVLIIAAVSSFDSSTEDVNRIFPNFYRPYFINWHNYIHNFHPKNNNASHCCTNDRPVPECSPP